MYVQEDKKLVYLAHPKTASKSTRAALQDQMGFLPSQAVPNSVATCAAARRPTGHHRPLIEHPGPEWTVFTTVRNHWDALVSWWGYSSRDKEPFGLEFIARIQARNPHYWPEHDRMWALHARFAGRVLRFESLKDDLSDVCGQRIYLPHNNRSEKRKRRPYQDFYTNELREYVAERYAAEIAEYGYNFEER